MEVFRAQRWVFSDKVNYAMQQCTFHEKNINIGQNFLL